MWAKLKLNRWVEWAWPFSISPLGHIQWMDKLERTSTQMGGHAVSIRLHEKLFDYLLMIVIDAGIK